MKRLFSHILILITGTILLASCTDETFSKSEELADGQVGLKLALNLPGGEYANTRAGGTNAGTGEENGKGYENRIQANDVRLLLFSRENYSNGYIFAEEVTGLKITGNEDAEIRFLEGKTTESYDGTIQLVVLFNLKSRGVEPRTAEFKNKSPEEVYQLLKYTYGTKEWTLSEDNRIPMWGNLSMPLRKGEVNKGTIDIYRAIAKTNVLVNNGEGLDNFELRSIRVYYANTKGYCAPLPSDMGTEENTKETPSIPADSEQREIAAPLSYIMKDFSEQTVTAFEDQIYIPESDNKNPGEDKKPLCLVIGGIFTGEGVAEAGQENYYRIDFKDDLESGSKDDLRVYDVVRNHSYVFNIRSVSNPGTTTPEDALENVVIGMDVSIEDWVDVPMRGIPDQYTLTTDKSWIEFDKDGTELNISGQKGAVKVWTDFNLTGSAENGTWNETGEKDGDWFDVKVSKDKNYVYVTAEKNYGVAREGHFYVQAGNLKKQINVYQSQPSTANCYVVSDNKEHELIVIIKGNGDSGINAVKDKSKEVVSLLEKEQTDASLSPAKIGIIWETKAGLVTLIDKNGKETTGGTFVSNYDTEKGTIKYKVNTNATIEGATGEVVRGGNALIGAFDTGGNILWSWHIWVCPDLADDNGNIKESFVEDWTSTGYRVMDRNLGALTNQPGVGSLGVLYQWGRKDPFIGANASNDDYENFKDKDGVLETIVYHGKWEIGNNTTAQVSYTIANPTKLTYNGLSENENDKRSSLLWGTDGGLNTDGVKDLGTKTIYDPCPIGYRVPPVDAFVFETTWKYSNKTGTKSSNNQNWNENLRYIPDDGKAENTWASDDANLLRYKSSEYTKAAVYGFYLNYIKNFTRPTIDTSSKTSYTYTYSKWVAGYWAYNNWIPGHWEEYTDSSSYYDKLTSYNNITWLPLSGAYNPKNSKGFTFKDVVIEHGSSLSVNSFLWTNSSVKNGTRTIPAAMFLHGTEGTGGNKNSGRHIHGMTQSNIKAEPHYAGAVRCVRNEEKDFSASNKVPTFSTFSKAGGTKESENGLVSINETWKVIDAGAPWISVFPESGEADKGRGQSFTVTVQPNKTGTSRNAKIVIQFSHGGLKTIEINQNR